MTLFIYIYSTSESTEWNRHVQRAQIQFKFSNVVLVNFWCFGETITVYFSVLPVFLLKVSSVIQLLFSILRTISHNFQFNSSTEGSLSKFLFETTHSASSSTDVDALKFRLVQYDKFYGGQNQERQQNHGVWNDWYQKLLYCLSGYVWIDYIMVFGLEQEDGSFDYSHGPLKAGRGISAETCGLDDMFPPDDLGSGPCTPFIIYIPYIIAAFFFGLLYVMFSLPSRIFYRGVPGFATDCPWRVWCHGSTTCLLYVGPHFGNLV